MLLISPDCSSLNLTPNFLPNIYGYSIFILHFPLACFILHFSFTLPLFTFTKIPLRMSLLCLDNNSLRLNILKMTPQGLNHCKINLFSTNVFVSHPILLAHKARLVEFTHPLCVLSSSIISNLYAHTNYTLLESYYHHLLLCNTLLAKQLSFNVCSQLES